MTLPPQAVMRRARIMGEIRSITALIPDRIYKIQQENKQLIL